MASVLQQLQNALTAVSDSLLLVVYIFIQAVMPSSKVKPSDVAAEAKKTYIPYIKKNFAPKWPAHSWLVADSSVMKCKPPAQELRCRMSIYLPIKLYSSFISHLNSAVLEGDPIDVALELGVTVNKVERVVLVNMANDKRAGGDWEAGSHKPVFS